MILILKMIFHFQPQDKMKLSINGHLVGVHLLKTKLNLKIFTYGLMFVVKTAQTWSPVATKAGIRGYFPKLRLV